MQPPSSCQKPVIVCAMTVFSAVYQKSVSLRGSAATVAIRTENVVNYWGFPTNWPVPRETDCHTSDTGHWFAMTAIVDTRMPFTVSLVCQPVRSDRLFKRLRRLQNAASCMISFRTEAACRLPRRSRKRG